MDKAWELERAFWEAGTTGDVQGYYARTLAAEAFVVVPGHLLRREDLLRQWDDRAPWVEYSLSEPLLVLVNGETVIMTYTVTARQQDGEPYVAQVSSVYVWTGDWALAFRQHTPDPGTAVGGIV